MRVLLVTTSYPSFPGDPSGHFVFAEAAQIAEEGHDVTVAVPEPASPRGRPEGDTTVVGVGGHRLFGWPSALSRARDNPLRVVDYVFFRHGVRSLLRQSSTFDRVIAHWLVPSAFPTLPRTLSDFEVRCHGADVRLLSALPPFLRHRILGNVLPRARLITFASHSLLSDLSRHLSGALLGELRRKAEVKAPPLHIPVISKEERDRATERYAKGRKVVACVARLVKGKGVDLVIEALATISGVTLVIVGSGPERGHLESLAKMCGVSAIFTGLLPRPQALAIVASADLLVHASAAEACPSVIREALSLGTPVVTTNVGDVALWPNARLSVTDRTLRAIRERVIAELSLSRNRDNDKEANEIA